MPPSLSVSLKREFMFSVVLQNTEIILQDMLSLAILPKLICSSPPGVKKVVPDLEGQFLGLGFSGVYVGIENDPETLVDVGVTSVHDGRPAWAYFSGGRTETSKALVAAFAIVVARLVGSFIEDGSGHWMPYDEFTPDQLMEAMTGFRYPTPPTE